MRAVVQRVRSARVTVEGEVTGEIGSGLLVFLGVGRDDRESDVDYMLRKIGGLRIFRDENGQMNLSVRQVDGRLLVVSQFTLFGDCRRGRRPSFGAAADPPEAERLYELFVSKARSAGFETETGKFGAMMDVELLNDGPVTLLLDSTKLI